MVKKKSKATGSGRDPSRKRSSTSETGVLRSIRDGREHVFESAQEKRHLIMLDADPAVRAYEAQPETFKFDGRRSYTPDARILTDAGEEFVEVKPERRIARDPTLRGRKDQIDAAAAERGASFRVATEKNYDDKVVRHNANLLRHSSRWKLPAAREQAKRMVTDSTDGVLLVDIVRRLRMGIVGKFAVLGLVADQELAIDASRMIGADTRVYMPGDRA